MENEKIEDIKASDSLSKNIFINKNNHKKKGHTFVGAKKGQIIFASIMLLIPLIQFFLFYICVNVSHIALAFQKYDKNGNLIFAGIENFKTLFYLFKNEAVYGYIVKNSFVAYLFATLIPLPIAMLFSYYVYKSGFLGNYFKIMLFVPSIISSIVLVMLYMYFVDYALPTFLELIFKVDVPAFYSNYNTRFVTIIAYSVIMGFGSNVLMFLSTMNSINESIIEAGKVEGATLFQEFIYIVFPMTYPTFVTYFIIGITGIFTNQLNLVSFMGTDRPLATVQTFGYYMYQQTLAGSGNYPRVAALGILISLVVAPTIFIVKWLLEKYGPSSEER